MKEDVKEKILLRSLAETWVWRLAAPGRPPSFCPPPQSWRLARLLHAERYITNRSFAPNGKGPMEVGPPAPTCSFNPSSVANGSGTPALTISTTGAHASLTSPSRVTFYAMWVPIGGLAMLGTSFTASQEKLLEGRVGVPGVFGPDLPGRLWGLVLRSRR
jgi:hypothetical protein